MRLPRKSISAGLTCVATYSAPECAKGRSSGFASVPYPPEIARRVDHASKAAALCPAMASVYHTLRCLGVSEYTTTGVFTGATGNAAGTAGSAAETVFGSGMEGSTLLAESDSFAVAGTVAPASETAPGA